MLKLSALSAESELKIANAKFLGALKKQAGRTANHLIGTPGGSVHLRTWYLEALDIWLAPDILENRYWNAIGVGDPFQKTAVAPTVEINLGRVGADGRIAGRALREVNENRIYIAHSGRVGGGKPGIGKRAFNQFLSSSDEVIVDGRKTQLYLLGSLDNQDELALNVADYAHHVAAFKSGAASKKFAPPIERPFCPEFEGSAEVEERSSYRATYTHGRIVNALYRALGLHGLKAARTRKLDLFVSPTTSCKGVVFEAKTSTDTQSIYTCVGQLMVLPPDNWHKIAVLPSPVPASVRTRLAELGIVVLACEVSGSREPRFVGLSSLVKKMNTAVST